MTEDAGQMTDERAPRSERMRQEQRLESIDPLGHPSSVIRPTITLRKPDDWHLHVRDGAMLRAVLPFTARNFGRAILMPNLVPPIVTTADAVAYRDRAFAHCPPGPPFTPLMTCYLRDDPDPDDVEGGFRDGIFTGVKLYPAPPPTNSAAGVTDLKNVSRVLERMQKIDMPFLMHGEVVDHD